MPIKAAYTGKDGEHFMGIPDRDLVDEDWERMSDDQKEMVSNSSFYRMVEVPSSVRRAEAKPAAKADEPVVEAPKAEAKK